jgi:hypothetical protein
MERLFSPCTKMRDGLLGRHMQHLQELNLDVSTEELLSAERAFTYADFYALLGNGETIVWLTPHAYVARDYAAVISAWVPSDETCHLCFSADGKNIYTCASSPEHLVELCDVVVRLLVVGCVRSLILSKLSSINAPTVAYLMEQCQSLEFLSLKDQEMDEDHCRVLGTYSRPGLEIELNSCKVTSAGARALAEVIGRNQGPTRLDYCQMDYLVLADGLRGNSRLKSLRPQFSSSQNSNREILAIVGALRENKGLVELGIARVSGCSGWVSDETWGVICDSLKTHPTLEVLDLRATTRDTALAPAAITSRIQALLDMLKVNMSIHTIHLDYDLYWQHKLFRGSVIPYFETNRLRPRVRAIQKTRPIPYRAKVLGSALLAVRSDPNRFWMLLLGNAEVAFPSKTATIVAAANLPTPAASAATSTANVTAVAASVISALTTTATARLPTAAAATATSTATPSTTSDAFAPTVASTANIAAPSAGQKRKARP